MILLVDARSEIPSVMVAVRRMVQVTKVVKSRHLKAAQTKVSNVVGGKALMTKKGLQKVRMTCKDAERVCTLATGGSGTDNAEVRD